MCVWRNVEKQKENPTAWDGANGFPLSYSLTDCDKKVLAIFFSFKAVNGSRQNSKMLLGLGRQRVGTSREGRRNSLMLLPTVSLI